MNTLMTPTILAADWLAAMMPVIESAPRDMQLVMAQEAAACGYAIGQVLADGGFIHPELVQAR